VIDFDSRYSVRVEGDGNVFGMNLMVMFGTKQHKIVQ
jgi:hypothetical protein